jgi:hypothetical protein
MLRTKPQASRMLGKCSTWHHIPAPLYYLTCDSRDHLHPPLQHFCKAYTTAQQVSGTSYQEPCKAFKA